MKADPLSAQVEIATCTWDVLPKHLKTGNTPTSWSTNSSGSSPIDQAGAVSNDWDCRAPTDCDPVECFRDWLRNCRDAGTRSARVIHERPQRH